MNPASRYRLASKRSVVGDCTSRVVGIARGWSEVRLERVVPGEHTAVAGKTRLASDLPWLGSRCDANGCAVRWLEGG